MAESSGFFPHVEGDAGTEYNNDFLAKWIASIISNGTYNGDLAVTADGSGMTVTLPAGRAWINGYYYRNDGPLTLSIANADGVLHRKDIIVLRWDVNARSITAQAIKGTSSSSPVAPAIVRTVEQYDLKLAEISVPAGTTAISQSLITDTRLDTSVCGIVHGVVDHIDTTTLYNQIQADLAGFKATNEADFTAWFQGIQGILGPDEAGNLLNMINDLAGDGRTAETVKGNADAIAAHISDPAVHVTTLACAKSGTNYALTGLTATSGKVSVRWKTDAAYAPGDTVAIDGTAYALKTKDGSALTPGAWAAGAIITGTVDVDAKTLTVAPSAPVGAIPFRDGVSFHADNPSTPIDSRAYIASLQLTSALIIINTANQPNLTNLPFAGILHISVTGGHATDNGHYYATLIARPMTGDGVAYHSSIYWSGSSETYTAWRSTADGGTSSDTASINSALTVTTAAPTSTLAAGKLWGVY